MASKAFFLYAHLIVYLLATKILITDVNADVCNVRSRARSLSSCLGAGRNARARVPHMCCRRVNDLITTAPKCLCAVLLSQLAINAGIKPAIAISIPKRCNIKRRPVGKKCGTYVVP